MDEGFMFGYCRGNVQDVEKMKNFGNLNLVNLRELLMREVRWEAIEDRMKKEK